jgi:hypothetical protein
VQANVKFLKALGETFHQPPWWKLWRTKAYKIIESTQDFMMGLVNYDQLFKKKKIIITIIVLFFNLQNCREILAGSSAKTN